MKKTPALVLLCALATLAPAAGGASQPPAPPGPQAQPPSRPSPPSPSPARPKPRPRREHSFLVWLVRVTGLSATSSGMRGGAEDASGDVWLQETAGGPLHRLTRDGGYSWPVFSADDLQVIAIRGGDLWALPVDGAPPVKLASAPEGLVSLVGSGPEGLVVLIADKIGTFSPETNAFSPFETTSPMERNEIIRLRSPARSYRDRLILSERNGVVVVEKDGQRREIVGDGAAALQPSASHTLNRVVFITPSAAPAHP